MEYKLKLFNANNCQVIIKCVIRKTSEKTSLIAFIFRKCVGVQFLGRGSMTMQILGKTGICDLKKRFSIDCAISMLRIWIPSSHEIIPFHATTKARVLFLTLTSSLLSYDSIFIQLSFSSFFLPPRKKLLWKISKIR